MSRTEPEDVRMPAGCRSDNPESAVEFEGIHVQLPPTEHGCPRCGRPMAGHRSFIRRMAHAVDHAPCRLESEAPRSRCKKRGTFVSEEVAFASPVSDSVTEALEERIARPLGKRSTVKEAATLRGVPYGAIRLVIDGAHVNKPRLPSVLLMDEIRAFSCRDRETGKKVAVCWTRAYDGEDGRLVDMIEGHGSEALNQRYSQLSAEERKRVKVFFSDMRDTFPDSAAKWLPLAVRAVDRFRVAKDGVARMYEAHRRIKKGAGNG